MGHRAKPAKAKVEAKRLPARKSPKDEVAKVRDLEKRLAEALARETATSETLRVIGSSPTDVRPVFDTIVRSAGQLCEATFAVLHRFDGQVVTFDAHHGMTEQEVAGSRDRFPLPTDRGTAVGRAILDRRTTHIHDIRRDAQYRVSAWQTSFQTVLAVPLLREGVPVGAIGLWRREIQPFSEQQIKLVETFADQAVIAIENVRLFNETKEALEQQTATSEILRVISRSPTDVEPVFITIAERVVTLCDGLFSRVFRFDGNLIHFVAHHNFTGEGLEEARRMYPRTPSRETQVATAILDRTVVEVRDVENDSGVSDVGRSLARALGYRSNLVVPMLLEGNPIGAIAVARANPGPFSVKQIALVQTFADQAVIAIENVRLFKELEARNRELTDALDRQTATSEILRVISSSPTDVQPVFDAIARNAVILCGGIRALVLRFDGVMLHVAGHHNMSPDGVEQVERAFPRRPGRDYPPGRAFVERSVVHVPDLQEATEFAASTARRRGVGSLLAVPLLREQEAVGVISLARDLVGPFSPQQIEVLKTFADQAVIAIENVRMFTELQEKNRALTTAHAQVTESLDQQTATSEILRIIGSSPTDVQPVFDTIARSGVSVCAALGCAVFVVDGDMLRVAATSGVRPERLERFRAEYPIPVSAQIDTAQAVRERSVFHLADIEHNPNATADVIEYARLAGYRTRLMVPMVRGNSALGLISVTREAPTPFPDQQVELLKTFADQAVIAIENVRLFTELQKRNRELLQALDRETATGEILRVINSSPTSVEPVFKAILANGMRLCQADVGLLFLVEGDTFRCVADRGAPPEFVEPRRRSHQSGPHTGLTRAIRERRPIHIEDLMADPAYTERDPTRLQTLDLLGARTGVWVPLLKEDAPVGVLVTWRREVQPFTTVEIDVLTTFANQAVIAIENVRLLRELDEKGRQLEAASQHKSEFLANMSHELRTPLNAIIGFSEVLSDRMFGDLNEKQEEYLRDIYASGQHLLSLINDILDLSKIEAGRMELELTAFHFPTALDNALMLVRERAGRRSITLQMSVDERLGEIRADERKIRQVVLNLLSNAIKFTPEGGRIEVAAVPRDGFVEVSVSDTGVGIAPEDQEAVFEEFRQVGTAEKKAEGTGLGLTLCRKFIELHGGRIGVRGQVNVGSTFTFTIPVRCVE